MRNGCLWLIALIVLAVLGAPIVVEAARAVDLDPGIVVRSTLAGLPLALLLAAVPSFVLGWNAHARKVRDQKRAGADAEFEKERRSLL